MSKLPYIILNDSLYRLFDLQNEVNRLISDGYIPASDLAIVPQPHDSNSGPQVVIAMMYAPAEAEMVMAMCAEGATQKRSETSRTNEGNGRGSCLCSCGSCSSFTSGDEGENEP